MPLHQSRFNAVDLRSAGVLKLFADILEYAGSLCHGNMVDQMVHDALKKKAATKFKKPVSP